MYRYKLCIAYNGEKYYGWQLQPQKNRPTVQGTIENSLSQFFDMRIPLIASSRTDAGVHARGQVAHITVPCYIKSQALFAHCIKTLPQDITVQSIEHVPLSFHSRHSLYKCYQYNIWNSRKQPTPFLAPFTWHRKNIDIEKMKEIIPQLIGTKNYAAFRNYTTTHEDAIRTIFSIYIEQSQEYEELFHITFWGNGFLRGMVRNLVGLLIERGRGKIRKKDIPQLLSYTQRKYIPAQTAPAHGLFLDHVQYQSYSILESCSFL